MATAAAVSPSCVSDRWIVTFSRCSAIAPVSRTRRRPRCQVPRRRRTLVRGVAALTGRERLREHRSRLVDLLREIGDGDQVDADANDAHPRNTSSRYLLCGQALTACTRRFRQAWTPDR